MMSWLDLNRKLLNHLRPIQGGVLKRSIDVVLFNGPAGPAPGEAAALLVITESPPAENY